MIFDNNRHDIIYKDAFHLLLCPAAADPRPAQRVDETDDDSEPDRPMHFDEERPGALIKALSQTRTWRKTPRFYPYYALPQQSKHGGIVQPQDRIRLDGGRPGVLCAPSTLPQLQFVSDRPQGS